MTNKSRPSRKRSQESDLIRIMQGGSPSEVLAALQGLRKAGEISFETGCERQPKEEFTCKSCGDKYRSEVELDYCPQCYDEGPDSGDYDFSADEDDLDE